MVPGNLTLRRYLRTFACLYRSSETQRYPWERSRALVIRHSDVAIS